jgi:putative phosphoesterase
MSPDACRRLSVVRVGVLSDVHGNLPALESVLADVEREGPDVVVVCGDVASGPLPAETIDLLMSRTATLFVEGNADRGLVAAFDGLPLSGWAGPYAEWCASRISRAQRDFIASFEKTIRLDVAGLGRVLFCHGSPRSDEEIMSARTSLRRLRTLLADVDAEAVVCGHTHMQFDRMIGTTRVVNAGSVGMPFGRTGADWLLIGPDVELRNTSYDLAQAGERIRETSYPQAIELATSLLQPPSETQMLELFTRISF